MARKIEITFSGLHETPSWVSIQDVIRTLLAEDGKITRIARRDGGCNYRAWGVYDATFITELSNHIDITLTITEGN